MALLLRPALLIIDEIGYLPLSDDGGRLFFQLVNARHERNSMILTTNKGFEEWGGVVGDEVMVTAMLDRLLHRCHVVIIQSASYRMRECKATRGRTELKSGKVAVATLLPPSQGAHEVDKSGTFKLDIDSGQLLTHHVRVAAMLEKPLQQNFRMRSQDARRLRPTRRGKLVAHVAEHRVASAIQ